MGIVVRVDGIESSVLWIQSTYIDHPIVVAVYDSNNKLIGLSEKTMTTSGINIIEVTTQL